jgi:hypothetical protein
MANGFAGRHEADPVLMGLLRLGRRGAAIGWADGGFGEGLLGWLDRDETATLVDALDAYPLGPDAVSGPDGADLGALRR